MAAPDKPNNLAILAGMVATIVAFTLMVIGCRELYLQILTVEQDKKINVPNEQLAALRADEQSKLSRYQWSDQAAGVVRIPVARAIELTLRDWKTRPTAPVVVPAADSVKPVDTKAAPTAPATKK